MLRCYVEYVTEQESLAHPPENPAQNDAGSEQDDQNQIDYNMNLPIIDNPASDAALAALIPTAQVISGVVVLNTPILPDSTNPGFVPGQNAAEIGVTYQVVDQNGQPMPISGAVVTEDIGGTVNGDSVYVVDQQFTVTDSAGQFTDPLGLSNYPSTGSWAVWGQVISVNGTSVAAVSYQFSLSANGVGNLTGTGTGFSGGPFVISSGNFVSPQ